MAVQKKNKGWWVVPIMAFALIYAAFAYTAQSEELYTINLELTELRAKIQKEKERQQSSIKERDEISSWAWFGMAKESSLIQINNGL